MDEEPPRFDEEVRRLLRALSLSAGPRFYFARCAGQAVADRVVDALRRGLRVDRPSAAAVRVIAPSFSGSQRGRSDRDRLLEDVVVWLSAEAHHSRQERCLYVLDTTRATQHEREDWGLVFQNLNARRNLLLAALPGELVVLLQGWMLEVLHEAAPDFHGAAAGEDFAFEGVNGDLRLELPPGADADVGERDPLRLREASLESLASLPTLSEGGAAWRAVGRTIALARAWARRAEGDVDAALTEAEALTFAARLASRIGELDRALALAVEAERVGREARDPEGDARSTRLARLAELVAEAAEATGRKELVIEANERAWQEAQRLPESRRNTIGRALVEGYRRVNEVTRAGRIEVQLPVELLSRQPRRNPSTPPPPGAAYDARYYVPRTALEDKVLSYLQRAGTPAALVGHAYTGKTWLVGRVVEELRTRSPAVRCLWVRLESLVGDVKSFENVQVVVESLISIVQNELEPPADEVESIRANPWMTPMLRLAEVIELVLQSSGDAMVVIFDVSARVASWPGWEDVEAVLRSWHERANDSPWDRLRLLLVLSTSSSLATRKMAVSPFKVAEIRVGSLTEDEGLELARRRGCAFSPTEWKALWRATEGHVGFLAATLDGHHRTKDLEKSLRRESNPELGAVWRQVGPDPIQQRALHQALCDIARGSVQDIPEVDRIILEGTGLIRRAPLGAWELALPIYEQFLRP